MNQDNQTNSKVPFLKSLFYHFSNSNTFQEGAALAYYAVFSILPTVLIIVSILGLIWGEKVVSGEFYTEFSNLLGNEAAQQIQEIIKNQHTQHNSLLMTVVGFVTLALSASGMLSQMHSAFNNIWNIAAKPKNSILAYFSKHLISFSILVTLFFTLILSVAINGFLVKYAGTISEAFPISVWAEHTVSYVLIALMFALMFRFLGDAVVHWKVSLIGGFFTAALFLLGKYAIGFYIGQSHISTTFGSASLLALIMVWVYYTSQIIFLGASFVYVFGKRTGRAVLPTEDSVEIFTDEIAKLND